jgi:hypothetical protein
MDAWTRGRMYDIQMNVFVSSMDYVRGSVPVPNMTFWCGSGS